MQDPMMPAPDNYEPTTPLPPAQPGTPTTGGNGPRRGLIALGSVVALLVVAFAVAGIAMARNASASPPSVTDILNHAKQAKLTSSTFTFTGNITLDLSGQQASSTPAPGSTTITVSGNGKYTTSPMRAQLATSIPLLGQEGNIQIITDGSNIYLQGLGTGDKWFKFALPQKDTHASGTPGDLSQAYDALQNPKLVGAEKIGSVETWHITGTVNPLASAKPGVAATATAIAKQTEVSANYTSTVDLWLSQSSYLPVQANVKVDANVAYNDNGKDSHSKATDAKLPTSAHIKLDLTLNLQSQNSSSVTITVPSPDQVTTQQPSLPGSLGGLGFGK
jgi:hypothetical protein